MVRVEQVRSRRVVRRRRVRAEPRERRWGVSAKPVTRTVPLARRRAVPRVPEDAAIRVKDLAGREGLIVMMGVLMGRVADIAISRKVQLVVSCGGPID